jgi:hypothetical protein
MSFDISGLKRPHDVSHPGKYHWRSCHWIRDHGNKLRISIDGGLCCSLPLPLQSHSSWVSGTYLCLRRHTSSPLLCRRLCWWRRNSPHDTWNGEKEVWPCLLGHGRGLRTERETAISWRIRYICDAWRVQA